MSLSRDEEYLHSEDLSVVCDGAVRAVHTVVDAASTAMYLFSKRGRLDRIAVTRQPDSDAPPDDHESILELVRRSVVASAGSKYASPRRYVVADDGRTHDVADTFLPIKPRSEILCLPLNGPNRTYGVIRCVGELSSSWEGFSSGTIADLPVLCHQIAISISNIRRQHEVTVHDRINTLVTSPFSLPDAFNTTAELLVAPWTDYAACTIRTIDDRGEFVLVGMQGATGVHLDTKRRDPKSPTEGLPARALATSEPQIVDRVQENLHLFSDPDWIAENRFSTAIVLPIATDDHKIGTLTLFAWFDIDFSRAQLRFLQAVCKSLATATTISRLVQARDQLIDRLRDLVTPEQTVEDLLQTILDGARDLTGGSEGYIALTHRGDRLLHPCTYTGGLRREDIPQISIDGEGLTALAAREERPVVCNDTRDDRFALAHVFVDLVGDWAGRVHSEIAVPMIYAGRLLGVIAIESERSGCFTADDAAILRTLAGTATLVFQRHRFHEATAHLANLAFPRNDRAALHARLAEAAAKLIDAEAAVLCVLEQRPRRLEVANAWPSALVSLPVELPEGAGLCWHVFETHEPEWFPDLSSNTGFFHREFVQGNGYRSMLSVPLYLTSSAGDDIEDLGVLNAFFNTATEPLPTEVQLMRAFAVAASHALWDAHFLDERQRSLALSASVARLRAITEVSDSVKEVATGLKEIEGHLQMALNSCQAAKCSTAAFDQITSATARVAVARDHLAALTGGDTDTTSSRDDDHDGAPDALLRVITKHVYESGLGPSLHIGEREMWDTVSVRLERIATGLHLGIALVYFARAYDYSGLRVVATSRRAPEAPPTLSFPSFESFRDLQSESPVQIPSTREKFGWIEPGGLVGSRVGYVYAREFIGGNLVVVVFGAEDGRTSLMRRSILHEMVNEQVFAYLERAMFRLELDELTSETGHLMGDAVGKVVSGVKVIQRELESGNSGYVSPLFRSAIQDIADGARRLRLIRQNFYAFSSESLADAQRRASTVPQDTFDVVQMLNGMREIFDAAAVRAELELIKYDIRPARVQVRGWADMLELALLNLMDNACKFAYKNTFVSLRLALSERQCLLTVENIGVGVAPDEQALVFQRLRRSRFRDPHRHIEGVGLGLPFCRRVIEQVFKGSIVLRSRPIDTRTGARFEGDNWLTSVTVTLPLVHRRRRR